MNIFKLTIRNAGRHKLRTALTIIGMAIAVMAFAVIRTAIEAWYSQASASSPNRLVANNDVSIIFTLPISYQSKIAAVPGVQSVAHAQWFGGIYVDPANFFPKFAVEAEPYLKMYPEFLIPPDQKETFLKERNAVIVGRRLADRFGFKVGDPVRIIGDIYPGDWDFVIRGIYTGAKENTDESSFIFHYAYVDERMRQEMPPRAGQVGWFMIQIDDPSRATAISNEIDAMFDNSAAETKTQTEEAFALSFVEMSGSIIVGMQIVSIMVIGIVLLVLANTMAMTARERIGEYAVLKTLGFGNGHIVGLIFGESFLIACLGGALGIALTFPIVGLMKVAMALYFSAFPMPALTFILAGGSALIVGILAAIFPAMKALRTSIVDGLRVVD
ncbi:MAG: ABC transporter permease [bacterium]|nr:ABC transporter permease [bacterium]